MDRNTTLNKLLTLVQDLTSELKRQKQSEELIKKCQTLAQRISPESIRDKKLQQIIALLRQYESNFSDLISSIRENAKEVASTVNKPVPKVVWNGPDFSLNLEQRQLLDKAMIHVLRNALDHGIENAAERKRLEKNTEGTLRIATQINNNKATIEISDDGRGLNIRRLREIGVNKGILKKDSKLQRVAETIFVPSISTMTKLTDLSGQGIGMDAIQDSLREMNGEASIALQESETNADSIPFKLLLTFPLE